MMAAIHMSLAANVLTRHHMRERRVSVSGGPDFLHSYGEFSLVKSSIRRRLRHPSWLYTSTASASKALVCP